MTIAKRLLTAFSAFALCAAIAFGSLSFMPKSFAVSDYEFPFTELEIPVPPSNTYSLVLASYNSSNNNYTLFSFSSAYPFSIASRYNYYYLFGGTNKPFSGYYWDSVRGSWTTVNSTPSLTLGPSSSISLGVPLPYSGSIDTSVFNGSTFSYSFLKPVYGKAYFSDYMPFYFPELPHGEFDGNINVVDGSYNIDFPSNFGISGTIDTADGSSTDQYSFSSSSSGGSGSFSFTLPSGEVGWYSGDNYTRVNDNDTSEGELYFNSNVSGSGTVSSSGGSSSGTITQTRVADRRVSLSLTGDDPVVSYTPSFNETTRFRSWSLVCDSSYIWFISDTRNKITGNVKSVSGDTVTLQYVMSANNNVVYPSWCIVFDPMGNCIQVVSPLVANLSNTYEVDCTIGTLEQDQDTGVWSCDPLYHGFWLSQDSPSLQDISNIQVAENKKYLANPVFGEEAFTLNFLNAINENITGLRSDLVSLQSAITGSISNQTSAFQNMDAPSAIQPSTSQMMDYFSKESAFHAPNTDEVFSGDIKSGHYWDGVTWWSSKFNDIIVSNEVIVAFTTAMLTLGLAVMIIGRRFSMR